jgi:serralysin
MAALGQDDYRVNSIQDPIQANGAPASVNAQLDVWNTSGAAPFTMTYQFETAQPADLWMSFSNWTAINAAEQAAIRSVLDEYQSVANVRFVEDDVTADPDINFGKVSLSAGVGGIGGWSFNVGWDGNGNITSRTMDHFAVFNNTFDLTDANNRSLLLHEIGHAMTLKHPGPYDVEGTIPPGPYLPAGEDSNKYTVMSYTVDPDNGLKSDHLMLYDIAALQARWGANTTYHTGNDVYTGPSGTIQTIWDAGGTDTIDGSGKGQAVSIDLHDGSFSSLGALNNFAIAFGAVIENAIGSAFNDTITGNDIANVLTGGGGNDTVNGAGGDDTFVLSGLRSQYQVTNLTATSATLTDLRGGSPDGTDSISNVEHVQFGDGTVNFNALGDPIAGSVIVSDVSIVEGNNGTQQAIFSVVRSGGTAAFNVNYATSDGTATTADGDYVAASGTLVFAANDTTKTFAVTINGDTKVESSETFNVTLSNATGGATISDGSGIGIIVNDDAAPVVGSVSINDVMIVEGNSGTQLAFFTVSRTGGTAAFDVNYATADGTATTTDGDYVAAASTLHFAANDTSKIVSITINGDAKVEGNENFTVALSNVTGGGTISDGSGTGIISNDDVAGPVAISDVNIVEGNSGTQLAFFTVARTGGAAIFDVDYATADGTATAADSDYVAAAGTLHFAANETSKIVSIAINGDTKLEANETFLVNLSNATSGATISDGTGVGTIINDDTGTITSAVSYTLGPNDLNLILTGTADLQGYGNAVNNVIDGNSGNNLIDGGPGADSMFGHAGNDTYFVDNTGDGVVENPNEGNDTVFSSVNYTLSANVENLVLQGSADLQGYGNAGTNVIYGNAGNNLIDGGAGADLMVGGAGNDTYFVDNTSDAAFESPNQGNDTVFSTANYGLAADVENLVLQGTADLQGYGNNQANVLYGNSGNNLLNGAGGADLMVGGAGNDVYFVDSPSDSCFETPGQGSDVVFASCSYGLAADVETLVMQGSGDFQGYGSNQANTIYGNAGNNLINGGGGADIMLGGAGNDTYFVDDTGDVVFENAGEGTDAIFATVSYTLSANVETLVLQGAGSLDGTGNALANSIFGNSGNNKLDGGAGADQLTGNAGNDTFVFHAGQANGDVVVDFAGAGAAAGDSLSFVGFGTAAQGATFTHVGATNQWQIHSGLDAHNEFITFANGATIDPSDVLFS